MGKARVGVRAKRLLLLALMGVAAVNMFTGAPLLAVWVGSRVQGEVGGIGMGPVLAVIGCLSLACLGLIWALDRLGRAHDELVGRPAHRRRAAWLRPFNEEAGTADPGGLGALDRVLVGAVVLAGLAFEAWFLLFAGSSIGAG